ncbi:MAG TPA: DUF6089 family protein [Ferruginibacter sp.]|nr:DUF6089 family protein [Ferruginibacter sp.]
MHKVFFLIFFFAALTVKAQNLHLTLFGGFSNYQGDLQEKGYTIDQAHPAFGVGLLYDINGHLSLRANVNQGTLSGNDKYNPRNFERNLNFSSPITDIHLGVEYNILNLNIRRFSPYLFAGISYFKFNPSTKDSAGQKIYLQPLSTEGQGFYEDRRAYKLGRFAIPFGAGIKFSITAAIRLAFEIGMRKTNTDYLDDISTTYIDQHILFANRGSQAVDLAFRGDELKTGLVYPGDGSQRGKEANKDWYYFSGFNVIIKLHDAARAYARRSKYGCPAAL